MAENNQFDQIKEALENKKNEVTRALQTQHSQALSWLGKNLGLEKIKDEHLGRIAAAAATGFLLLSPGHPGEKMLPAPHVALLENKEEASVASLLTGFDKGSTIGQNLKQLTVGTLTPEKKTDIENLLNDSFGIKARFVLDGYQMNVDKGLIGAEQHLYRWQGDTLASHLETKNDQLMFGPSGVAPNRGAWGYFGNSADKTAILNERYYFAVQTFLTPNWHRDQRATYNWFKFRKMIAVNTKTGQAVVGVVGDAGPAQWTGKSYGGSPEVMHHLGLGSGPRKGEILLMFVDDPDGTIPLGPVPLKQLGKI